MAIIPLYIFVVAFPNIFGDIIANIVLPIANKKAMMIRILYSDIIFKNFFNVPLKSVALSTALGPPIFPAIKVPPPLIAIKQFLYIFYKILKALYAYHFPLFRLHLKQ